MAEGCKARNCRLSALTWQHTLYEDLPLGREAEALSVATWSYLLSG